MTPAQNLAGNILNGRWSLIEALRIVDSTGGAFSVAYRAEEIGTKKKAFVKIIDLVRTLFGNYNGLPVHEAIRRVTDNHAFEVFLAETCRERRMSRVVHALDSGELPIDVPPLGTIQLPFIVFEWAEHGDVHSLLTVARDLDVAWKVQVLHQVATGVKQLHAAEIAHQDIKRSNVVFIEPSDGKIIDLGRAVKKDRTSRNDLRDIPCQIPNAAPELLYGFAMADWAQRHFATDLYMLGNLAFTLLFDVTITERLVTKLPPALRPFTFGGTYADVLPALQHALASVLADVEALVPEPIREDYLAALRMLCEPDPGLRGHPTERRHAHANRYSMQRFISLFDSMRRKAATRL